MGQVWADKCPKLHNQENQNQSKIRIYCALYLFTLGLVRQPAWKMFNFITSHLFTWPFHTSGVSIVVRFEVEELENGSNIAKSFYIPWRWIVWRVDKDVIHKILMETLRISGYFEEQGVGCFSSGLGWLISTEVQYRDWRGKKSYRHIERKVTAQHSNSSRIATR